MSDDQPPSLTYFERPAFFHGMLATADDWQAAHDYHVGLRWLHNRAMHTPGIVRGVLDEFLVTASEQGDELRIRPGMALDGVGRELFLPAEVRLPVRYEPDPVKSVLYLAASYKEKRTDFRQPPDNPALHGHARVQEAVDLAFTFEPPDNLGALELARIRLEGRQPKILNPERSVPGPNEIDRTHTCSAGVRQPFSLSTSAELVRHGKVSVPAGKEPEVRLDTVAADQARFYVVNVRPGTSGELSFELRTRMGAPAPDGTATIDYVIVFKNPGSGVTQGMYKVYRLPE